MPGPKFLNTVRRLSVTLRWHRRQMRRWARASAGVTVLLALPVLAAFLAEGLVPTSGWINWVVLAVLYACPALVVVVWARNVPHFWPRAGGLIWVGLLLIGALAQILAMSLAAETFNLAFSEAAVHFPVSLAAATLLATPPLITAGAALIVLVTLLLRMVGELFLSAILGRRSGFRNILAQLGVGFLFSVTMVILLAPSLVMAFNGAGVIRAIWLWADFQRVHRCNREGWPPGISRVVAIGDQQVLGWQQKTDRLLILPCIRPIDKG